MNVAFRHEAADARASIGRKDRAHALHARIDVYDDLAAAAPAWRQLEDLDALSTPYQRFAWIDLWHRHVSGPQGLTPLIVVARDAMGAPLFLLPFLRRRKGSVTIAGFFGGRHANLNAGLWRRDVACAITADELRAIFAEVAERHGIDLFKLSSQPAKIAGVDNPLALFPSQRTPDDVYSTTLSGSNGEEALRSCLKSAMRGRLRTKERKLAEFPGYRYNVAATTADADRYLDAFLKQKAAHLEAQGIRNVFDDADIVAFLRAGCHDGLAEGRPIIEMHVLECDDDVIAVFGGVRDDRRLSCMINSYTMGEGRRWSPGLVLLTHLVRYCGEHGIGCLDLGAGYAEYKTFFCKETERTFDTIIGFSQVGRVTAAALTVTRGLKRKLKATPSLWSAMKLVRKLVH